MTSSVAFGNIAMTWGADSKKYRVTRLVHVEEYDKPADAIAREKQLKGCAANGRTNWSVLPTPNGAICCRQERRKRSRSA
jgi:hypothetical protein